MFSLTYGTVVALILSTAIFITAIDYEDNDLAKGNPLDSNFENIPLRYCESSSLVQGLIVVPIMVPTIII